MGHDFSRPGLHSKYYDQEMVPLVEVVQDTVNQYPYLSTRERDCVRVHIQQDFCFQGSRPLFAQVLTNLLKNADLWMADTSNWQRLPAGATRGRPW